MNSLYLERQKNIFRTWLLFTIFLILIISLGWFLSVYFQNQNILFWAAGLSILMSLTSFWFSDKLVVAMTGARPAKREEAATLYAIIEKLKEKAGLPMPKIYIVEDPSPNAFATGRSPEKAVLAVTSGLLRELDGVELEGVIAHELSHIRNRDMLVSTLAVILAGFVAIVSDFFLRAVLWGRINRDDNRGQNAIVIVMVMIGAILAPLAATLIRLAISRKREFLADASGATLIGSPDGLASALQKIAAYPRGVRRAQNVTAHLWFQNPFRGAGIYKLFLTHPPVEERIRALKGK